ncbi:Cell shape-determining protein MreB [subsurface metagenome]
MLSHIIHFPPSLANFLIFLDFCFLPYYNEPMFKDIFKLKIWGDSLGIDLGTTNTLIWAKKKGIILNMPSILALTRKEGKVLGIGEEAKDMLGKAPQNIVVVRPLEGGVIADFDIAQKMIECFISQVQSYRRLIGPRLVIGVPSQATKVEKKAVVDIGTQLGARRVHLVAEPVAAAIGSGLPVSEPVGNMIVDIGGGTSEAAITSLSGVVLSKSIRIAGDEMDRVITQYIREDHNILIGEQMAERVKISIGCVGPSSAKETMKARGKDLVTGFPVEIELNSEELGIVLSPVIDIICNMIEATLEESPPELAGDIMRRGVFLAGGGACLKGFDRYISERTHLSVSKTEDPLLSVVKGTGMLLENSNLLSLVEITPDFQ